MCVAKYGHPKNGWVARPLPVRFLNLNRLENQNRNCCLSKLRIQSSLKCLTYIFSHKLDYRANQLDSQVDQVIEEIDNESEASDADYVEEVPESTPVRPKKKSKKVRIQAPKKTKKAKYALSSESSEAVISDDESSPDSDFD